MRYSGFGRSPATILLLLPFLLPLWVLCAALRAVRKSRK